MIYEISCEACEKARRKHILGCDCRGEQIAVAGGLVYTWGEYWRGELDALAARNPGKPVRLVCKQTGIAFAGYVPNETTAVNQ